MAWRGNSGQLLAQFHECSGAVHPAGVRHRNGGGTAIWSKLERQDCLAWTQGRRVILLDVWHGRLNFPELKQQALRVFHKWMPDSLAIEAKPPGGPCRPPACVISKPCRRTAARTR